MEIEKIIDNLARETNDSKKFALLLILAQLIKSKKLNEFETSLQTDDDRYAFNERLFKAINPNFLAKLIVNTSETPENCPKNIYKSVAMSILVQFKDYPNLITDPVLLTKIKVLFDYIEQSSTNVTLENEEETNLFENCFKYFFALSDYCYNHLCKNGLLKCLKQLILTNIQKKSCKYTHIAIELFLKNLQQDLHSKFECEKEIKEFLNDIYNHLKTIDHEKIDLKIELFKLIGNLYKSPYYFSYLENNRQLNESLQKCIIQEIDCFMRVSRLEKSFIYEFLNDFLTHFDCKLILNHDKKLLYLIIHLISVDIRISIESTQINLLENDTQMLALVTNISIFEKLLVFIENIPDEDIGGEDKLFDDIIKIFVEVINSIITYLEDMLDEKNYSTRTQQFFFISLIRLVSCWYSFEELNEEHFFKFLPKILQFFDTFSRNESSDINVYLFVLPSIRRYLENNKQSYESIKRKANEFGEADFDLMEIYDSLLEIEKTCQNCMKKYS